MINEIQRMTIRAAGPSRIHIEEMRESRNLLLLKIEVWPDSTAESCGINPGHNGPLFLFPREARALMEALQILLGERNG